MRITASMYYGGLKFVPLGFKRLAILQSIHKVKLNLSSCFTRVRFAKEKHDYKINFTLWTDCRITNLLNPRGKELQSPIVHSDPHVMVAHRQSGKQGSLHIKKDTHSGRRQLVFCTVLSSGRSGRSDTWCKSTNFMHDAIVSYLNRILLSLNFYTGHKSQP